MVLRKWVYIIVEMPTSYECYEELKKSALSEYWKRKKYSEKRVCKYCKEEFIIKWGEEHYFMCFKCFKNPPEQKLNGFSFIL